MTKSRTDAEAHEEASAGPRTIETPSDLVDLTLVHEGGGRSADPDGSPESGWLVSVGELARTTGPDLDGAFALARSWGREAPMPAGGRTGELWSRMATLASVDLTAARVVEPHLDALAIIDQCPDAVDLPSTGADVDSVWGVYAAEGPGMQVLAEQDDSGRWLLDGVKPWCSLAGRVTHAIITARTAGGRRAFAVDLRDAGVEVMDPAWRSRGLVDVPSGPIRLTRVPAVPVGPDQWYLSRPGFAWGGIGVAACWLGGAVGVARTLRDSAARREPDQISLMHLGAVDSILYAAMSTLGRAAQLVDAGAADGSAGGLLASRARAVVAQAVDDVVLRVSHATGPGPLTADERHARRVADLQVYVRQHHAERDQAGLGRALHSTGEWAW